MGSESGSVARYVVCHRSDDTGRPRFLGLLNADAELFESGLGLDDDCVDASLNERFGLLGERIADPLRWDVAVGLHQAAKRPNVAQDEPWPVAERLSRQFDARLIDRPDLVAALVAL